MKPFLVHLTPELLDALRDHRESVGVPMSETVRRALAAYLADREPASASA